MTPDGPPIHGNTGLEIAWTAVPAILVIAIGIVSAVVLARNGEAGTRPLEVNVVGQQFTWKFVYSDYNDLTTGELVLPVGREARFTMTAVDVIHSFWVPNFGQKMDAVPGIETTILVTPTRVGEFAGRLRRALRSRARDHACESPRRHAGCIRPLDRGEAGGMTTTADHSTHERALSRALRAAARPGLAHPLRSRAGAWCLDGPALLRPRDASHPRTARTGGAGSRSG